MYIADRLCRLSREDRRLSLLGVDLSTSGPAVRTTFAQGRITGKVHRRGGWRSGRSSAVRSTGHMRCCAGVVGSELVNCGLCADLKWDVVLGCPFII